MIVTRGGERNESSRQSDIGTHKRGKATQTIRRYRKELGQASGKSTGKAGGRNLNGTHSIMRAAEIQRGRKSEGGGMRVGVGSGKNDTCNHKSDSTNSDTDIRDPITFSKRGA